MFKKAFIIILLFGLIGELLIRINEQYSPFSGKVVKINLNIHITPEYNLLKSNSIDLKANNLRILVLGDSYVRGGGIPFEDNFSSQLKLILNKNNNKFDNIYVLDVSRGLANNFDDEQTYFRFAEKFKPQIVILGFSYDGISGDLDKKAQSQTIDRFTGVALAANGTPLISKIYSIIYSSHLIHFTLNRLHNNLKAQGIIIPNSEFDLKLRSYYQNDEAWIKSKKIFQNIIAHTKKNNTQLIVLKFPEINLLEYDNLFVKTDSAISSFFHGYPSVKFIDGSAILKKGPAKEYVLNPFDGHLNEKGHKKLAIETAKIINGK